MSGRDVTIHQATKADLSSVETILAENRLPVADVGPHPEWFYIASVHGTRVGVGGLEPYDDVGLLRSVVVDASARGLGIGTALCDGLESIARTRGIDTIYLLTTTAADFFANRGYHPIDRSAAPATIQHTNQFADLCPSTATCMKKSL
ncbi:MAG: arsenic resistance N-acetyltransferase ArsN2 [Halobacteriales archaeon]